MFNYYPFFNFAVYANDHITQEVQIKSLLPFNLELGSKSKPLDLSQTAAETRD